jgi:hypothetical protein
VAAVDEMPTLYKSNPNLVVNPNLPDRGVKKDISWLKASLPTADYAKLEEANTAGRRRSALMESKRATRRRSARPASRSCSGLTGTGHGVHTRR